MQSIHEPVLLHEIIADFTSVKRDTSKPFWYLDGTLGGAGHALSIAKALGKDAGSANLGIIGLDRDQEAIERAKETLKGQAGKIILECENFRNIDKVLVKNDIAGVDLILLDLGISSDELDNSGRGFTFQKDEPLLMTMGDPKNYPFTAKDIVNSWSEEVIADVIYGYGEERFARRIAKNIVGYRVKKPIETTNELVEIVRMSVPGFYKRGKLNPATKTFQALRIAVNDELASLREGLKKGYENLNKGGRMAVISFHSLEDRIVKEFFKAKVDEADERDESADKKSGAKSNTKSVEKNGGAKIITKKPIVASLQEIAENPRSRSAKLRIIEKV